MKISILSVFPEIYDNFLETSLVRRAKENGLVDYDLDSFKSFVKPKERIDAPTFGPGAGMVIKAQVVQKAIDSKEKKFGLACKVFFSPQGKKLDQDLLKKIYESGQKKGHLMLLPARYEGMDARAQEYYADEVVSIGDFVLMGGDLPAMILMEGLLRLIPGVIGKAESVQKESFSGPFLDYPSYAEPVVWKGLEVPEVIRSGNHKKIDQWRVAQAAQKTVLTHFHWLRSKNMTKEQMDFAKTFIPNHYVALMHTDVFVNKEYRVGETSVTSLDIHDIARSSKTFGLKNYFIVTPLLDQQKIVNKMLSFWQGDVGKDYNISRSESIKNVQVKAHLDDVINLIEKQEGKQPIIITTSAKFWSKGNNITFYDQGAVWSKKRPVLLIFGTAQGLSDAVMDRADFNLVPIEGFSDYNHLSVRSAAAIVFDRWLGINVKKVKKRLSSRLFYRIVINKTKDF